MAKRQELTGAIPRVRYCTPALALGLALLLAPGARAESPAPVLGASPLPPKVELRFCYYAGLAYSVGSMITIDVANRREVVTDRPRKTFRCSTDESEQGRHFWQEIDPDAGDPFRD